MMNEQGAGRGSGGDDRTGGVARDWDWEDRWWRRGEGGNGWSEAVVKPESRRRRQAAKRGDGGGCRVSQLGLLCMFLPWCWQASVHPCSTSRTLELAVRCWHNYQSFTRTKPQAPRMAETQRTKEELLHKLARQSCADDPFAGRYRQPACMHRGSIKHHGG